MYPLIALFIFLNILVGQIPGCSVSGGLIQSKNSGKPSSSANKHNNPVPKVQWLLYGPNLEPASRDDYHTTIELARELVDTMKKSPQTELETKYLLNGISTLSRLEEQSRQGVGIQCDMGNLWPVIDTRKRMNEASGKNEFIDEAAEHPLNRMINDLTDILFEACSRDINDGIEKFRFSVHEDRAENDAKFALINLDRFEKILKLPKDPVIFSDRRIPYSFIALNDTLIDVDTKLEPEDLQFLGVPQENTLSRNELLQRLIERTCGQINEDDSVMEFLTSGEVFAQYANDIYKQTGKEYYFRSEIAFHRICRVLPVLMLRPKKKIS